MYAQYRFWNYQIKPQSHRKSKNEKNYEITCNCKIKTSCPVEGKFFTKSVIYKATIIYNNKEHFYIGYTVRNFKTRYYEHMHSFRNKNLKESTQLSSFILGPTSTKIWLKTLLLMLLNIIKWNIMHKINLCKLSRIWTLCNSIRW